MKYLFIILTCVIGGCSIPVSNFEVTPKYDVTPTVVLPHDEVMAIDFPTKKSVFVRFGSPTNKETFEGIENWYYKLSQVTNSNSIIRSTGVGQIGQNPNNPGLPPIARTLITTQANLSNTVTNSTTVETYLKFWFVNDSVMQWETFGVNFAREVPNPAYNVEQDRENQKIRKSQIQYQQKIVMIVSTAVLLIFIAFSI
jgi:hypothetical protein